MRRQSIVSIVSNGVRRQFKPNFIVRHRQQIISIDTTWHCDAKQIQHSMRFFAMFANARKCNHSGVLFVRCLVLSIYHNLAGALNGAARYYVYLATRMTRF